MPLSLAKTWVGDGYEGLVKNPASRCLGRFSVPRLRTPRPSLAWMTNKYAWPLVGSAAVAIAFAAVIWIFAG